MAAAALLLPALQLAVAASKPHNVMYIVIGPCRSNRPRLYASVPLRSASPAASANSSLRADDLRPELGLYQATNTLTPNLDQLGKESLTFDRAYVQVALCGPSRESLLLPGSISGA